MLKDISRTQLVGTWCAAVTVVGACAVVAGATLTLATVELFMVACLVPPAVLLAVWRGAPPATVAELLHTLNRHD